MPSYGRFEVVQEIHRGGLGHVALARASDEDGRAKYAVKVFEVSVQLAGAEEAEAALRRFLEAAALQSRAAESGSHWAPVHDSGKAEQSAYYVTDHFPGSGDRLARGRVKLSTAALHRIMADATSALQELETLAGRGHGNLKAANVFLTAEGDPANGSVVLADPLPGERLPEDGGRRADFRAMGTVLYELVLHQRLSSRTAWPLPEDAAWARLGREGAAWRDLCSRLLAPNVEQGFANLDDLAAAVEALKPQPRSKLPVLAATLVAVAIIAGGFFWWMNRGGGNGPTPVREFDPAVWAAFCGEHDWYTDVQNALDANRSHPEVAAFLDATAVHDPPDPASIHGRGSVTPSQLPTLPVGDHTTDEGIEQTERGRRSIASFATALSEWSLLEGLRSHAESFRSRGWIPIAEHLESATAPESFALGADDTRVKIGLVLNLDADVKGVQDVWTEVESAISTFEASNDGVLKSFTMFAKAHPADAVPGADDGLADLQNHVDQVRDLGQRLVARLKEARLNEADLDAFQASPTYPATSSLDMSTPDPYTLWMQEVKAFFALDPKDDPRVPTWTSDIASLNASLDRVERDAADALNASDREQIAAIRKALTELLSDADRIASMRWIEQNRDPITDGADDVDARLLARNSEVTSVLNRLLRDLDTRIEGINVDSIAQSAAINAQWNALRATIQGIDPTDSSIYRHLDRIEGSRAVLENLSAQFPRATVKRPADLGPGQGDWISSIDRALAERRERELEAVIAAVDWSAEPFDPDGLEQDVAAARALRESAFAESLQDANRLVEAFVQIERALDLAYAPSEVIPSLGATPVNALADAQTLVFYQHSTAQDALAGVVSRVQATTNLAQTQDRATLLNTMTEADPTESPEIIRTGWSTLTAMPSGGGSTDLEDLRRASNQMLAMIQSIKDPERASALDAARRDALPRLWMAHFDVVRDQAALDHAFGQANTFNFTRERLSELTSTAQFNYLLKEFRLVAPTLEETAIPARVQKFIDDTASVRSAVTLPASFWSELDALVVAAPTNAGVDDLQGAGPGKVGWSWAGGTEAEPEYQWGDHRIRFVRVEDASGEVVYIAATELPVKLAIDWINDSQQASAFSDMTDLMRQRNYPNLNLPVAHRFGPQAWGFTGRQRENFRRGSRWLPNSWKNIQAPTMQGVSKVSPEIDEGQPSDLSPLQGFPPDGAALIADRLGCRLPSVGEWQAALNLSRSNPGSVNRRDATWVTQYVYIRDLRPARVGEWPSIGGFRTGATQPPELDSQPAVPGSDGVLWFADVSSSGGRPFDHMVGNVAEYVTPQPVDRGDSIGRMTFGESQGLVSQLRVIGASAMTPPDVQPEQAYPLPAQQDEVSKFGFADVGIRLAFPAPSVSLNRQLADALGRSTFVFK